MRAIVSFCLAIGLLLTVTGTAAAHNPTGGAAAKYAPGTLLTYKYSASGYPSWLQSGTQAALGTDWRSSTFNNTKLPSFTYSAGGTGTVYYSSSTSSPCGSGNTQWLQCANNWGSTSWRIYVRNFSGAPYRSWTWCNISYSGTCWDLERALLHETEHVTMGVSGHDDQGEANTIMASVTPAYASVGWNTHHLQRCDQAAGQLLAGLGSPTGPIADCFDHAAGHGTVGLIPAITSTTASLTVCLSKAATLAGTFGIAADGRYQKLAGQLLGGRTIWFDRKPSTSSTWTLNVASATTGTAGTNWTRAFSTTSSATVTYHFRPHTSAEAGLDAATGPIIAVTWRTGC